jgi:hypothetical protein
MTHLPFMARSWPRLVSHNGTLLTCHADHFLSQGPTISADRGAWVDFWLPSVAYHQGHRRELAFRKDSEVIRWVRPMDNTVDVQLDHQSCSGEA